MNTEHRTEDDVEMMDRLAERIHRLADRVDAPDVSPDDDLVRGRRRAHSGQLAAGAAALAVGVLLAGTSYLVHDATQPGGTGAGVMPAAGGRFSSTPNPGGHQADKRSGRADEGHLKIRSAKEKAARHGLQLDPVLQDYRAAVADVLDPHGKHLDAKVTNQQSGGGILGTKLGWKVGAGMGEIMISVARPGADDGGFSPYFSPRVCAPVAGRACTPVRLADGTTGQQQRAGGELAVYYTRPDGQVVLIVESALFGNNSRVSIDTLPATARQLLRVATDPRLTLKR